MISDIFVAVQIIHKFYPRRINNSESAGNFLEAISKILFAKEAG